MQNKTSIKVWSERWRLGALERSEVIQIGLVSAVIGMMFVMFHNICSNMKKFFRNRGKRISLSLSNNFFTRCNI